MLKKRNRSINWDEQEKQLLRHVLKEYAKVIENKSLYTDINKKKSEAWGEIFKKFNELNNRFRELSQIRIQWKKMKGIARKNYSTFKIERNKTDGEAQHEPPCDEVIEIKNLSNPAELMRDSNIYDSDGNCLQEDKATTPENNNLGTTKKVDDEYTKNMISHSKMLKSEEHTRRMQMAEEEHSIKMAIYKEKLKCTILEREILEYEKACNEKHNKHYL